MSMSVVVVSEDRETRRGPAAAVSPSCGDGGAELALAVRIYFKAYACVCMCEEDVTFACENTR